MPLNKSEFAVFEKLKELEKAHPKKPLNESTIEELRSGDKEALQYVGPPATVHYQNMFIQGRDNHAIPIRIYNDDITEETPVFIFFPGCGYTSDLFEANAIVCSRVAHHTKIRIIVVNYRLTPEYPLLTVINDAYDATKFISKNPKMFNIDASKLLIGGGSSGAHCAAVISNLAKENKEFSIYHQILLNGLYDLTQSNHEYDQFAQVDQLCRRDDVDYLVKSLWKIDTSQLKDPIYSPYFESNLSNIPPTTILVGEYDGLRNDSEAYYKKIKEEKGQVNKIMLPGQSHSTILMREVMTDGEDPAKVIANIINKLIKPD